MPTPGEKREANRLKMKRWREKNPERNRTGYERRYSVAKQSGHNYDVSLRRQFGITLADYEKLLADQHGVCYICGKPETVVHCGQVRRLAVDHDHTTGKVRRLLCTVCNTRVGWVEEDPILVEKIQAYIRQFGA
jgi:hypothetical protein